MSRWLSDPGVLAEQAAGYRDLIARRDLPGLADAVLRAACRNGAMTGPGEANMELLRALPDPDRRALGRIWADLLPTLRDEGPHVFEDYRRPAGHVRAELLVVASGVVRGLDPGLLAAERQARLRALGGQFVIATGNRDWELVTAEVAAGRTPGPEVLAVLRRTALVHHAEPAMRQVTAALPGPVLNPGEPWADRALTDIAGDRAGDATADAGGGAWQRLMEHRAPRTARAPSPRWARTGRELLAAVGPQEARRRLHAWLSLVGQPRPLPLRSHRCDDVDHARRPDPYNSQALRGLAWLLSLLPPTPGSASVLGRLTDTALVPLPSGLPTAPEVAEAAVVALGLLEGADARAELEDLAGRVAHRVVARRIATALTGR
ncbi:hypothetical protein ACFYVL_30745 [Streptomyces sp. NPDC004111]|uniref:hypothetical protein n=1 Tax=Streptomyces sp. NPDC004111 TaxID=3364690 RepID=UPI0036849EE9